MKTLKSFPHKHRHHSAYKGPEGKVAAVEKKPAILSDHSYPGKDFFTDPAPEETALERLDRLLAFLDERRPNGICEAVLATYRPDTGYLQYEVWADLLVERGFVEVSSSRNSNSNNRVHIFHRVKDKAQ